jgi:hypothetical protein
LREVYTLTADEIDAAIAEFRAALDTELAKFESIAGS